MAAEGPWVTFRAGGLDTDRPVESGPALVRGEWRHRQALGVGSRQQDQNKIAARPISKLLSLGQGFDPFRLQSPPPP